MFRSQDHRQRRERPAASAAACRLRAALLGAVAVVAVGGTLAQPTLWGSEQAYAQQIKPQPAPAQIAPGSFADVVDRVSPAVVSVKVKITEDDDDDERRSPQACRTSRRAIRWSASSASSARTACRTQPHPRTGMAQGSGFFISADGYIVTNNHVVEHATDVQVTMQDGTTVPAKVVGTDKKTDLALLKVKTGDKPFAYVPWAEHSPRVGDWVIAVGNPFGLGGTVTAGIVSARGRDIGAGPYDDFLQIDAPVNRGNSGGPTFNTRRPGRRRQHRHLLALGRQRRHRLRHPGRSRQGRRRVAEDQRLGGARLARRPDPAGDRRHRRHARPEGDQGRARGRAAEGLAGRRGRHQVG